MREAILKSFAGIPYDYVEPGLRDLDHNMLSYEGGGGAGNCMGCICCPETGYESIWYIRYGEPLPDILRNVESLEVFLAPDLYISYFQIDGFLLSTISP